MAPAGDGAGQGGAGQGGAGPLPLHSTRLFPKNRGATAYVPTGIAARCDWLVLSDAAAPRTALVRRVPTDRPRHVFLSLRDPFAALRFFATEVLAQLRAPFVLVSGSEDVTIPHQTDRRWRSFDAGERALLDAILDHPCLLRWWAENLDAACHPRLTPLPVGMVWPDGPPDPSAPPPVPPPLGPRPLRVLCAHRIREGPQWQPRRDVSALAAGPWAAFAERPAGELPEADFHARLQANSFVLCVEGGGLDPSPKAWTALLHGAIPILRDTPVAAAYRALPVVVVPDWTADALDPDRLRAWKAALHPRFDTPRGRAEWHGRLGLEYWWQRISADARPPPPDDPAAGAGAAV